MKRYFGGRGVGRGGVGTVEYSVNWPQWVQAVFLSRQLRHVALKHSAFNFGTNMDDLDDECQVNHCVSSVDPCFLQRFWGIRKSIIQLLVNLCIPRGVVFICYKNEYIYKNACQACSLHQNPIKLYIFIKCGKNTFTSIIEIMTHVKIVTSQ